MSICECWTPSRFSSARHTRALSLPLDDDAHTRRPPWRHPTRLRAGAKRCPARAVGALLACLTLICTSCVGPISDNVASEFRKQWIAQYTNYHGQTSTTVTNTPGTDKELSRSSTPASTAPFSSPINQINSEEQRNDFITAGLIVKDLQFKNYVTALRRGASYGGIAADGSRLVLDGLASVTGGATVKAGLAAASAGITGINGPFKKDVLFDQSLPTFLQKMAALRDNKRADILQKESKKLNDYTAMQAFADVEEYGNLGTFDSALLALNTETATSANTAKNMAAQANGDNATAAATGGSGASASGYSPPAAPAPYVGPINSTTVRIPSFSRVRQPPDVNRLRGDVGKLSEESAGHVLGTARTYPQLRAEFTANQQGVQKDRDYLFRLIDVAAKESDPDRRERELRAWRNIISANPVTPTPSPSPSPTPG